MFIACDMSSTAMRMHLNDPKWSSTTSNDSKCLYTVQSPNMLTTLFELWLQCLAVFRFIRVLPCTTSHGWTKDIPSAKRNFSTLLPSASQIQCLPWKCQTPGTKRVALELCIYQLILVRLLLCYVSSTASSRSSRNPTALLNHFTTSFWKVAGWP